MAAYLGIATSMISIVSCTYTIVVVTREWKRRLDFTKELSDVHQREIEVLRKVIKECQEIVRSANYIPASIDESFENCATREGDLVKLLERQRQIPFKVAETVRLSLLKKDIKRRYNMYRESVILLRELCSELRTQQQLVGMSAGMARLAWDVVDGGGEIEDQEQAYCPGSTKYNATIQTRLSTALDQLGSFNYVIKATVVVEQFAQERGQRFKYVNTTAAHTPALVKLDTGSDVDVVSREFLIQAGFAPNAFVPIPDEAKGSFIGIEGTQYRPDTTIELYWFREGEQQIRRTTFYVVSGAPVDMLLGSKQFAQEAAKRVALFANSPKSKATLELEKKHEAERLREAALVEEARLHEELARRQVRSRIISQSSNAVPDLEQGSTAPANQ